MKVLPAIFQSNGKLRAAIITRMSSKDAFRARRLKFFPRHVASGPRGPREAQMLRMLGVLGSCVGGFMQNQDVQCDGF